MLEHLPNFYNWLSAKKIKTNIIDPDQNAFEEAV